VVIGANPPTVIQGPAFAPYQPASMDTNQAEFWTVSSQIFEGVDSEKTPIPSGKWAWAYCPSGWPGTPNPNWICLKNATFNPSLLYEMAYTAKNPLVLGVGFAAFRDLGSFLRYETAAPGGGSNPISGTVKKTYTVGSSQSGAFIHGFIFWGFNKDENGRTVFDGAWPQIDGRMMVMNIRWGQPNNLMYLYMAATKHRSGGRTIRTWPVAFRPTACSTVAHRAIHVRRSWKPSVRRSSIPKSSRQACAVSLALRTFRCLRMSIGTTRRALRMAVAMAASPGLPPPPGAWPYRPVSRFPIIQFRRRLPTMR
jgi:hypothetical protein